MLRALQHTKGALRLQECKAYESDGIQLCATALHNHHQHLDEVILSLFRA